MLPGLRQHSRHLGQGIRLPVRVGDGPGDFRGLLVLPGLRQHSRHLGQGIRLPAGVGDGPGDRLRLLVLPGLCQRSRDLGQGPACRPGSVMDRAAASACPATSAACWCCPVCGQRRRDPRQGVCLHVRVGDGGGEGLGAGGLAEGGPDGGQAGRDVGVAVGELVAVAGQAQRSWPGPGQSWAAMRSRAVRISARAAASPPVRSSMRSWRAGSLAQAVMRGRSPRASRSR